MSRVWADAVQDMLVAMADAAAFTAGMTFEQFAADRKTVSAVVRSLEVVGEAAKAVPDDARARCPGVPWRRLTGMRDKLIHAYFGVSLPLVWNAVQTELPALRPHLEKLLGAGEASPGAGQP